MQSDSEDNRSELMIIPKLPYVSSSVDDRSTEAEQQAQMERLP